MSQQEIHNSTTVRAQVKDDDGDLMRIDLDPATIDEVHSRSEGFAMTIELKDGTSIEAYHLDFATL